MLMYGSVRGSRWLILPWLVATLLFIVAYCAGMVLSTILFGVNVLSLAFLAIAIIESCIALYLWLCVISLFQHLADRQTNTQVHSFIIIHFGESIKKYLFSARQQLFLGLGAEAKAEHELQGTSFRGAIGSWKATAASPRAAASLDQSAKALSWAGPSQLT